MREALQAGVDPNSTDGPMQRSCLMVAILNDHKEVVDLLLSWPSIKVNAKDRQNSSALHLACYSGNVACLNKLLTIPGIRLNEKDHQGRTPIMRAIKYGKIEAVRVMTAVDEVDLEVKDNQGRDLEEFASWSVGWQSLIFPWTVFVLMHILRVAEVVRGHGGPPPKSLDSDENLKPEHTLFCRELRFVAIYALFWRSLSKKSALLSPKQCFLGKKCTNTSYIS